MSHHARRKKFVDVSVQGSLVRRIVFHWALFLITTAFVAFLLQVLSNPFRPISEHIQSLSWTHGPLLLVTIFLLPVFVVDTIKLSHRFTGPIFALCRAMREVAEGKKPRKLNFRSDDFWHELAEEYNAMLQKLGADVKGGEEITDELELTAAGNLRD